jgi:hypothetical protein
MDMYENEGALLDPIWFCFLLACWRMKIVIDLVGGQEEKLQLQLSF